MGRKANRYIRENENNNNGIRIGIYARVSVKNIESESIINQLMICNDYIYNKLNEKSDYKKCIYNREIDNKYKCEVREYTDIGVSGYSIKRKEYIRLLDDIKYGKINCVIVKDLSRLGRNYLEVSSFIEQYIALNKVRFISVNDNYDSFMDCGERIFEIWMKCIFNEMYVRDTGRKIHIAKKNIMLEGNYVGVYAPYGYKLEKIDNKRKLIVDKKASEIVRIIYKIFLKYESINKVREYLYSNRICTKRDYYNIGEIFYDNNCIKKWTYKSIKDVLTNEAYIGNLVQGKTKRVYNLEKIKRQNNEKDKIIYIKNTHKKIIADTDFYQVQNILIK